MSELFASSHRRLNPLTGEWVMVSPHRADRPWLGQTERPAGKAVPAYDPGCYLCPGNPRANGERNPRYDGTFVFTNDFAALLPEASHERIDRGGLIVAEGEPGLCRVICFTPRHDLTLARMEATEIARVVAVWQEQYRELGAHSAINYVQIFENHGAMMGASNPHPHCQIWASRGIPNEVAKESACQARHRDGRGSCLLCDYLALEIRSPDRIVCENAHFVALVPFWALWPFEMLVLPRRHVAAIDMLDQAEGLALADILRQVTVRYDNLFETDFPYSMGFHQRPSDGEPHPEWHLHAHFYPPLLRSATVRKFMVGYELLAGPQRDITPEAAAERLRALSGRHYLEAEK